MWGLVQCEGRLWTPSEGLVSLLHCLPRCCCQSRSRSTEDLCCFLSGMLLMPFVDAVSQPHSGGASGHYRSGREHNAAHLVVLALALLDVRLDCLAVVEGMPFLATELALGPACCAACACDFGGLLAGFVPALDDHLKHLSEVRDGFCKGVEGLGGRIRSRGRDVVVQGRSGRRRLLRWNSAG